MANDTELKKKGMFDRKLFFLADAIVAMDKRSKDDIPFLYSFLDLLQISTDFPVHISVGSSQVASDFYVSTDPLIHCQQNVNLPATSIENINFVVKTKSNGSLCNNSIKTFQELLHQIQIYPKSDFSQITHRVHSALQSLYMDFQQRNKQSSAQHNNTNTVEHEKIIVEDIAKESLAKLSKYLLPAFDNVFVVVRYYDSSNWQTKRVVNSKGDKINCEVCLHDIPKDIRKPIADAFETGFTQLHADSHGGVILYIPCHLGGEPWVVFCLSLNQWPQDWWEAYVFYRDYISKIFEELRVASQQVFAAEMLKLLKLAREDTSDQPQKMLSVVNNYWIQLNYIFPLFLPKLIPTDKSETTEDPIIRIDGGEYAIKSSHSRSLFVSKFQLRSKEKNELWAYFKLDSLFKETFIDPANEYLNYEKHRYELFTRISAMENALVHYGHTLAHRVAPIIDYFEGIDNERQRAAGNAKMLKDMGLVLQLSNVKDIQSLMSHPKKIRFLAYTEDSKPLNLLSLIKDDCSRLVEKIRKLQTNSNTNDLEECWVQLSIDGKTKDAVIDYTLKDTSDKYCRLGDFLYRELFYELLRNAANYGKPTKTEEHKNGLKVYIAPVNIQNSQIHEKTVLVFRNFTDKTPLAHLQSETWAKWPVGHEHDGPGMAISNIRRFGLGEMWHCYDSLRNIFSVAVYLEGLKFINA